MAPKITPAFLADTFAVTEEAAEEALIVLADPAINDDDKLEKLNAILGFHGIEYAVVDVLDPIKSLGEHVAGSAGEDPSSRDLEREEREENFPYDDYSEIVRYLNAGDSYAPTLLLAKKGFVVTSIGGYSEAVERQASEEFLGIPESERTNLPEAISLAPEDLLKDFPELGFTHPSLRRVIREVESGEIQTFEDLLFALPGNKHDSEFYPLKLSVKAASRYPEVYRAATLKGISMALTSPDASTVRDHEMVIPVSGGIEGDRMNPIYAMIEPGDGVIASVGPPTQEMIESGRVLPANDYLTHQVYNLIAAIEYAYQAGLWSEGERHFNSEDDAMYDLFSESILRLNNELARMEVSSLYISNTIDMPDPARDIINATLPVSLSMRGIKLMRPDLDETPRIEPLLKMDRTFAQKHLDAAISAVNDVCGKPDSISILVQDKFREPISHFVLDGDQAAGAMVNVGVPGAIGKSFPLAGADGDMPALRDSEIVIAITDPNDDSVHEIIGKLDPQDFRSPELEEILSLTMKSDSIEKSTKRFEQAWGISSDDSRTVIPVSSLPVVPGEASAAYVVEVSPSQEVAIKMGSDTNWDEALLMSRIETKGISSLLSSEDAMEFRGSLVEQIKSNADKGDQLSVNIMAQQTGSSIPPGVNPLDKLINDIRECALNEPHNALTYGIYTDMVKAVIADQQDYQSLQVNVDGIDKEAFMKANQTAVKLMPELRLQAASNDEPATLDRSSLTDLYVPSPVVLKACQAFKEQSLENEGADQDVERKQKSSFSMK